MDVELVHRRRNQVEIPDMAVDMAVDLYRRRMVSGSRRSLLDAVAEMAVVCLYHRVLTLDDLDNRLELRPTDEQGRKVHIITKRGWPLEVPSQELDDGDIYVFAWALSKQEGLFYGWLPAQLVEQAPIQWFVKDGRRFNYAHRIDSASYLSPMPSSFEFSGCSHLENYGGIWDFRKEAWECCHCGQFLYDSVHRDEFLPRYWANSVGNSKQAPEEKMERPQDK